MLLFLFIPPATACIPQTFYLFFLLRRIFVYITFALDDIIKVFDISYPSGCPKVSPRLCAIPKMFHI